MGVFGSEPPEAIAAVARSVGLAVVQLHGDTNAQEIEALRESWGGAVWAAAKNLLAQGLLGEDERIVLFNTGSGFKYL